MNSIRASDRLCWVCRIKTLKMRTASNVGRPFEPRPAHPAGVSSTVGTGLNPEQNYLRGACMHCLPLQVVFDAPIDPASMYSVCLRSVGLPLTKMGSRAACVSLGHRHSRATLPARLTRRRSDRWSISSHSQIPMSRSSSLQLRHFQPTGPVPFSCGQHCPCDPCQFVCHCNTGDIRVGALLQGIDPLCQWRRAIAHEIKTVRAPWIKSFRR